GDALLPPTAVKDDRYTRPWRRVDDHRCQLISVADRGVVVTHHDVTWTEPRVLSRRSRFYAADDSALRLGDAQLFGSFVGNRRRENLHAKLPALNRSLPQLRQKLFHRVNRHRESDSDVSAALITGQDGRIDAHDLAV